MPPTNSGGHHAGPDAGASPITRATVAASVLSAQSRRCSPSSQRSPGRVTAWRGGSGSASAGSGADAPSASAVASPPMGWSASWRGSPSITVSSAAARIETSSSAEKPNAATSISAACTLASASRSSAWSQVAFSAIRLSARRSASFCAGDKCRSTITGTLAMPSAAAASNRPWPAISTPSSSTSSGLVKPKARMLALSCSSCPALCTRAFPPPFCHRRHRANAVP